MSKTIEDRKVNRNIKRLNKTIREDVFKDRFEIRQYRKDTKNGIHYYQYKLIDNEQPERNELTSWKTAFEITMFNSMWQEMNKFIVTSDFWNKYNDID